MKSLHNRGEEEEDLNREEQEVEETVEKEAEENEEESDLEKKEKKEQRLYMSPRDRAKPKARTHRDSKAQGQERIKV